MAKLRHDGEWYKNAAGVYVQAEPIGTSIMSAATTGDVLAVASDDTVEAMTLTAGTDITVTHGAGTITIASTASVGGGGGATLLTLINGGAEAGDTSGWTQSGGGFTSELANPTGHTVTPVEGTRCFVASSNANVLQSQDVDVSAHSTAIDASKVVGGFTVAAAPTFTTPEDALATLDALDVSDASLGRVQVNIPRQGATAGVWFRLDARMLLPIGTRSLRVTMQAFRLSGTANNVAFDDARAYLVGA